MNNYITKAEVIKILERISMKLQMIDEYNLSNLIKTEINNLKDE